MQTPIRPAIRLAIWLLAVVCAGCAAQQVRPEDSRTGQPSESQEFAPEPPSTGAATPTQMGAKVQRGLASFYSHRLAGRRTASGERYDPRQMTAAHRTLPFGSWVEVRRQSDGRRVVVRINDRGPYVRGRIIDLSNRAAEALGMVREGSAEVEIRRLTSSR